MTVSKPFAERVVSILSLPHMPRSFSRHSLYSPKTEVKLHMIGPIHSAPFVLTERIKSKCSSRFLRLHFFIAARQLSVELIDKIIYG